MQSIALGASKVPFLREPKKTKEIINEDDYFALLSAPQNNTRFGIRDQALMILLYDSAIRVNELLELQISSIHFEASIPYIRVHGKGDKERIVAINDRTVAHLKKYLGLFHEENELERPLFYTIIKGVLAPMSTGNVERIINKYAEQVRPNHPTLPKKVHPHMFRRTRATNLYQNGVELELVSRILDNHRTNADYSYICHTINRNDEGGHGWEQVLMAFQKSNLYGFKTRKSWLVFVD